MFNLSKPIKNIMELGYLREMLSNLQPVSASDTPIYDQLEREWAKKHVNW